MNPTFSAISFPQLNSNISEKRSLSRSLRRENTLGKPPKSAEISTSATWTLAPAQPQRSYDLHTPLSVPRSENKEGECNSPSAPFSYKVLTRHATSTTLVCWLRPGSLLARKPGALKKPAEDGGWATTAFQPSWTKITSERYSLQQGPHRSSAMRCCSHLKHSGNPGLGWQSTMRTTFQILGCPPWADALALSTELPPLVIRHMDHPVLRFR